MLARRTTFLALVCAPSGAWAADIAVGTNGDFATIQMAIDNSANGDRIRVDPGVYAEVLYIDGRDLTIESTGGRGVTSVISPYSQPYGGDLVSVLAQSDVTFTGFTLDAMSERRTILVGYDSLLHLDDMAVTHGVNADGFPGGLLDVFTGSAVDVTNSVFDGGDATGGVFPYGGNIGIEDVSSIDFGDNVVVSGGRATRGGGLWVDGGASADVWRATFLSNAAVGYGNNDGGGICAEPGAQLTVSESSFLYNEAGLDGGSSGGGVFTASGFTWVTDSSFVGNTAHLGGGVGVENSSVAVVNSNFDTNIADKGAGLGCDSAPLCGLVQSRLYLGIASQGGGLYAWNSSSAVVADSFCNNSVSDPIAGPFADGGAIRQSEGSLLLRNTVFSNNSAASDGGAVAVNDAFFDSRNNHYIDSTAGAEGGAIHVVDSFGLFVSATSVNDLFLRSEASINGAVSYGPGLGTTVDYAWLVDSVPGPGTIGLSPTNAVNAGDAQLGGGILAPCDPANLAPVAGSPLINAGDPAILNPDGTRSDIGAFGGPLADGAAEDQDGDGAIAALDCDDGDAAVGYPGRWHPDADGDGYGDLASWVDACLPPAGYIDDGTDCDDTDASITPLTWWYWDLDDDGYGDPNWPYQGCDPGGPLVLNADDCNDYDASITVAGLWHLDLDRDGFGVDESFLSCSPPEDVATVGGDCNDDNPNIHPGETELCDGVDQDCNGLVDDDAADGEPLHPDQDGDGYGAVDTVGACNPDGFTKDATDCDDLDPNVHPGAEEVWYDGVDADCDGRDDDRDGDGFGIAEDCDDLDPRVNPDGVDAYDDGVDGDCDGVEARTWIGGGTGCACDSGAVPGLGWTPWLGLLVVFGRRRS